MYGIRSSPSANLKEVNEHFYDPKLIQQFFERLFSRREFFHTATLLGVNATIADSLTGFAAWRWRFLQSVQLSRPECCYGRSTPVHESPPDSGAGTARWVQLVLLLPHFRGGRAVAGSLVRVDTSQILYPQIDNRDVRKPHKRDRFFWWLDDWLSSCAGISGQPLADPSPLLPWSMDEHRQLPDKSLAGCANLDLHILTPKPEKTCRMLPSSLNLRNTKRLTVLARCEAAAPDHLRDDLGGNRI